MGSSSIDVYGPDFLLTGDVVLVTTNYRVGLLGIYLQNEVIPFLLHKHFRFPSTG